jgi:UDP-N-acetylmuramoyl-L-alanyl-D-glutamate--2,6-diaminopimelate ligase
MKLRELVTQDAVYDARFAGREVAGIAADSRAVKRNFLFVAVPGTKADGLSYVSEALAAGATTVMAERAPLALPDDIAFIKVTNVRRALALMAAAFYRRQPETIAAVTGTSGKTSVAAFTRQVWVRLGHAASSIGTIGLVSPQRAVYGSLTTPDPVGLHRSLAELVSEGVTHLAIEASSHGLDQYRLDGMRIRVGSFTNITRDHLDYHPSFEAYLRAKLRLFTELIAPDGTAVVDVDHAHADAFATAATVRGLRLLSVGRRGEDIRLLDTVIEGFTQIMQVAHADRTYRLRLPLVGAFQVENALVAAGQAIATDCDPAAVFGALEHVEGAKGRLERVGDKNGAPIFVDYAHKPDALAKALDALRPYVKNRLILVFGAGGDRDQGKRPLMGAIATEKADHVIVTDDNPRSEDPSAIRAAILKTASGALEIADRGEAIRRAVAELDAGDVLLVAGKGHESGQIVGNRILPFTDHEAVAAALEGQMA